MAFPDALQSVLLGIYASCLQGILQVIEVELCSQRYIGVSVSVAVKFDCKEDVPGSGLYGFLLMWVQFPDFDQDTLGVKESYVERNPGVLHPETLPLWFFREKQHAMAGCQTLAMHETLASLFLGKRQLKLEFVGIEADGKPVVRPEIATAPFFIRRARPARCDQRQRNEQAKEFSASY